jgi:phenylacetate-CoA ligase
LVELEGRPPVIFRARDGRPINNIDVSIALRHLPIAQHALHQSADGTLRLTVREAGVAFDAIRAPLLALFGSAQPLTIEETNSLDLPGGKLIQYTSDLK